MLHMHIALGKMMITQYKKSQLYTKQIHYHTAHVICDQTRHTSIYNKDS